MADETMYDAFVAELVRRGWGEHLPAINDQLAVMRGVLGSLPVIAAGSWAWHWWCV
jgi:hypothetical protein